MVDISTSRVALIKPEWIDKVPSPAYDSLSPAQRRETRLANPWSFLNVTLSPEDLASDAHSTQEITNDQLVTLARESIDRITKARAFADPDDAMYLYQLTKGSHTQTALVADVATQAYESGQIKIHEQIQQAKADLLAEHLRRVGVISSPIAMTFRTTNLIADLFKNCLSETPALKIDIGTDISQTVWKISDKHMINQFISAFRERSLYIIDGHHRAAATLTANRHIKRNSNTPIPLFSALFPQNELQLHGFNRWIRPGPDKVTADDLAALAGCKYIDTYRAPEKTELILYTNGRWLSLNLHEQPGGQNRKDTDFSLLQYILLEPVFGIKQSDHPRIQNIAHTQGHQQLCSQADQHGGCAVFIAPLTVEQFLEIADTEALLPPKSTYFTPKVQSGVFLRSTEG